MKKKDYLRNHILAVLASYSEKHVSLINMSELADEITEAVLDAETHITISRERLDYKDMLKQFDNDF